MRRREFIAAFGSAATLPLAAHAQQAGPAVVGYLSAGMPEATAHLAAAFRKGLSEAGYVDGKNVTIEYRWAYNDYSRLPELAAGLVNRRVAVIAAVAGTPAALAAKAATTTIPIVFTTGSDPIQIGLVASINRPGGNVTGIAAMTAETGAKRLELLRGLVPTAKRFAVLVNPGNQLTESIVATLRAAGASIGRQIEVVTASTNRDIDTAIATVAQQRDAALLVSPDPFFDARRVQLITLAMRHRNARDLSVPRICRGRRPSKLRSKLYRNCTLGWRVIPVEFSKAKSLLTCRFCKRQSSNLSSTCKRREFLA